MSVDVLRIVTVVVWLGTELVLQVRGWRRGGPTRSREWTSLVVILVAVAAASVLASLVVPLVGEVRGPVLAGVGLVVAWVGIGLRLWAIHTLGRFFRPVVTVSADHAVVRAGPYRWLRHPAYTGVLVGVLGLACSAGLLGGLFVTLGVTVGTIYRIRVEERMLIDALGEDYRSYAATTWRLIPGVW